MSNPWTRPTKTQNAARRLHYSSEGEANNPQTGAHMSEWKFTKSEKKAIDDAASAARYLCDHRTGMTSEFDDAVKYERKQRSCLTTARSLIVSSFLKGLQDNPSAKELAFMSRGCATAVLLGARFADDSEPADWLVKFPILAKAAAIAHTSYIDRGLGRAAAAS